MHRKKISSKTVDICMSIMGVALLAVFAFSAHISGQAQVRESKRVNSLAEISAPAVPNITTDRATGVISAAEWASYYPEIYASWMENSTNDGQPSRIAYTETNPDIQTLYQGMAFSFDYTEAIGHNYTLTDIAETTRPHKLANCLTCKTPDMTALVNAQGTEIYSADFETIYSQVSESVSCYSCHGNTPGTMVISSDYMAQAMGDEIESCILPASSISCAQCHIEYYFAPETKATSVPYSTLAEISPDAILKFYNDMGFVDYTNENTGVGMIKVQHPEFETYYGEGSVHAGMYTCADCHMGISYTDKGDPYANHKLISPLDNPELVKNTCSVCHEDLAGMIENIQVNMVARENAVSAMLVEINTKLAKAIADETLSEDKIELVKKLDRDAQFYWDFVYVENSEGAHNSKLDNACLDKAEELAAQALAILNNY